MDLKRIKPSEKDQLALQKLIASRKIIEHSQPRNYKNCVVLKPWGYEYLIFENEEVAIWFLKINGKHSTSMHCHPAKKTSLILLSGRVLCNTFQRRSYLSALSGLTIEKAVFHSTQALSSGGIELLEVETPPNKMDLVRLNDAYGRESHGYEGLSEMETQDLRRFNYFYFEEPVARESQTHLSENYSLAVETFFDNDHFQNSFRLTKDSLYILCKGQLLNVQENVLSDVGEAVSGWILEKQGGLKIKDKTVLLKVRGKNHENH